MSSDHFLNPVGALPHALTADGFYPSVLLQADDCCGPDLCMQSCDLACSFVDLLPSGPMWDVAKDLAKENLAQGGTYDPCNPPCMTEQCPTLISYAVHMSGILRDLIGNTLWPSLRESQPHTAVTTLDDWLDRFGWQDCFRSSCRTVYMAELSPYEVIDEECGTTEYCPTAFSVEFECAVKHATLLALSRSSRGVIRNINGLNWIIAPLGVAIRPQQPFPPVEVAQTDCVPVFTEGAKGPTCYCDTVALEIYSTSDTLPGCPSINGNCEGSPAAVPAKQTYTCLTQDPVELYPATLTAQCILLSLMGKQCPSIFFTAEVT